jgi:S-methylmethionine-dependent homocysteine/selenocysteine methylase
VTSYNEYTNKQPRACSLENLGLGINCTDPRYICDGLEIASSMLGSKSSHPIVVYPNKGW